MFGDGREERMDALDLELRLRTDPEVTRRREDYYRRVGLAKAEAIRIGNKAVIDALVADCPAYIRSLLESEDERFCAGALAERYARTFWKRFP